MRKSPFITEVRHEKPAVPLCQTHVNRPLGQAGWVHASGEVEWMQTWTNMVITDKVAKAQEMRGFTAGGTTEYRTATTISSNGEEMEGGFREATMTVLINKETTARGDLQHCPEDLHIGQHNENKPHKIHKYTNHNNPHFPEGIGHGFGDSGGNGGQVEEGEGEEEEVHGAVEVVVTDYSSDDESIAQEGSQVDAQEEPEVQELQFPFVCEC
ncbi:hypothetical protein QYF61_021337 [Mycteria americana]|uniref:Uncharacterized protein n=1 Tax=Mycteria americana TaxID=33587 RepID=A0AAN7MLG0_MYCAM|nr:hypothetical protein QYF61_021337 [Mycteria americana]